MGLPRARSSGRPQQQISKNNKLISPDKTIGSTPPNSPPNFDEDFNNNVFSNEVEGEDRLAPLRAVAPAAHPINQSNITTASKMSGLETQNYSNRPAVHNNNSNIISPNSSPTKQQLNTSSTNQRGSTPLRVDKILCRAPSHESNISDLSASLSPIGPRGHLSSPPTNTNNNKQQTVSKYNGNIVTELLNECGVLENVNDILNEAGFHDFGEIPPPPPPQDSAAKRESGAAAGNKEEKKYRYEKPAVWGVAPDDDDTYMDSPVKNKNNLKPSVTEESVEYDNVELVLDESTLNPSSFDANNKGKGKRPPTPTSGLKKFMGGSSSSRNTKSTNKDSSSGGGILKKLKKSTPPTQISPSDSKSDGRSTPGVNVIENKNDPRISHTYDVTEFENDNLAPTSEGLVGEGGQGSGEKGGEGIKKKGSFGNLMKKNSRSKGSNKSDPFEGMYCQPVDDSGGLATKDRSGLSATPSGEVEINSAPVLKSANGNDKGKKQQQPKTPKRSFFKKNKSHNEVVQNMGHVNVSEEQSKISSLAMGSPSRGRFSNKSIKSNLGDKLERLDESTATSNNKKKNKLIGMNLPPTPVNASSNLSQEQLTQAKYWNATLDKSSNKIYYYHRVTKEVTWIKPLGYDEVNNATSSTENIERSRTMPTSNVGRGKVDINKEKENAANTTTTAAKKNTPTTTPSRKKIGLGSMLSKKSKSKVDAVDNSKQISTAKSEAALAAVQESTKITSANTAAKQTKSNWRATIDASTNKTYYYNKKTKEVSWTKPDGFGNEEVSGAKAEEKEVEETLAMASVAEKRKKSGWFKKKSTAEEEGGVDEVKKAEDKATTTAAADETIKYWRATKDASTGKTYYFNKKTKLVQWTKPEGYDEMMKLKAVDDEKKKKEGVVAVEKGNSSGKDVTKKEGEVGGIETLSTGMADINDDESEIEGFNDAEAIGGDAAAANKPPVTDEDAPFDEPEAPFDEPMAPPPSSPKRVTQSKQEPQENKSDADDDADEQEDLFDEQEDSYDSDHLPGQQPMYGRVKSLKSIDLGRKSTFTSHMTDTTRKATNTRSAPMSPRPIAREIFTDNKKSDITNDKEQVTSRRPDSASREKLRDGLQMPPTPTRTYGRNRSGGNRYSGKRAENLGDSSNDESTLESKQQHRRQEDDHDEYWSGDDVSALSGIGNESIESKRKRRDAANRKKREVSVLKECL